MPTGLPQITRMPRPCTVPDSISALWFLPTFGDGRYLGSPEYARAGDFAYLKQIALAADFLGFEGVLIPTGRSCEDSWLVASALAPLTERLRFLVAVRPGVASPTQAARMTATLDRLSNGRALINVVSGGDPQENRGDGLFWSHAERYRATEEFLNVSHSTPRWGIGDVLGRIHSCRRRPYFVSDRSAAASAVL